MKNKLIIWILGIIMLMSSVMGALTDNMEVYYSFDTGTVTANLIDDQSTNGYDGTNNGCDIDTAGLLNEGLVFVTANSDYVNTTEFFNLGVGSISFWVKKVGVFANDVYFAKNGGGATNGYAQYSNAAGHLDFYASGNANVANFGVPPTTWVHYVITTNGTHYNHYINGTHQATTPSAADMFTGAFPFELGRYNGASEYYGGEMDEFGIWSRELTSTEVTELYNSGNGLNPYDIITITNFTLTSKAVYWNNTVDDFNATVGGIYYETTNGTITTGFLSNATTTYNIESEALGYFDVSFNNYNVSSDLQINFTRNESILNATAFQFNGTKIQIFNITAISYNSSHIATATTTTGETTVNLNWNESYKVIIDAEGYALYNNEIIANTANFFQIINYTNLYLNQTLLLHFKDEETDNSIYNVSFELISDLFSANYTTNPYNNINLSLITPEEYVVRYSANNYLERFYYFTLTSRSFNNLTLYLVNGSKVSNVTATVYDSVGSKLEGARIEVLKFDILTNSYVLREQAETNWEGITILHLVKNTEFYKFNIIYPTNGTIRLSTNPTYIYDDSITFQINTEDPIAEDFYTIQGITYDLTFNDATNNFRYTYSDPSASTVTQACLTITRTIGINTQTYNSSCLFTTSGTILVGVEALNGSTYAATATVTFDGESHFLEKLLKTFQQKNNTGNLGLFMAVLLSIVFAIIGYYLAGAAGTLIATPLPMLFMSLIGFIAFDKGIIIFLEVIAIIIAFVISRR